MQDVNAKVLDDFAQFFAPLRDRYKRAVYRLRENVRKDRCLTKY